MCTRPFRLPDTLTYEQFVLCAVKEAHGRAALGIDDVTEAILLCETGDACTATGTEFVFKQFSVAFSAGLFQATPVYTRMRSEYNVDGIFTAANEIVNIFFFAILHKLPTRMTELSIVQTSITFDAILVQKISTMKSRIIMPLAA